MSLENEPNPQFKKGDKVWLINPNTKEKLKKGVVTKDSGSKKTLMHLEGSSFSEYLPNEQLEHLTH